MKKRVKEESFAKLHIQRFGLACGIITALSVFFLNVLGLYGFFPFSNMFIADMYGSFGFAFKWPNLLLGSVYSFIDAFIGGAIFAWLYNVIGSK